MKIVFAFFLLLNIVRCYNVSDFTILRLKNYPKVTKDKEKIHVDFEVLVERNINIKRFRAHEGSFFVFSLLYPLNLKLLRKSQLTYVGGFDKVNDLPVTDNSYEVLADKFKTGGFLGKCSKYTALDIVFNLNSKISKAIGVNDENTLKSEISALSSADDFVFHLYHFEETLKRGVYTFSADFESRKDLSATKITTYYDEFVLALGIKNHLKERASEEMKCLTKTPITSAIMIKYFEKHSFQPVFCSYYFGYDLSEPKYQLPLRNDLKVTAKFEREPLSGAVSLTLDLAVDEKIKSELLSSLEVDIAVDLPKTFVGKKLDETKLCNPEFTPELSRVTCKYDSEKGRVTYNTLKSYLEGQSKLKIKMDVSEADFSSYLTADKTSEVSAYIYYKTLSEKINLEGVDFSHEISSSEKFKFLTEECSSVVKELTGDLYKQALSKKYLLYGGSGKVDMNVFQTLMYTISKVDEFNVMKVYLSVDPKLAGQKATLKFTAGRPDEEFFALPTEADYQKNKSLPRNKGVTRSLNKVSVAFEYGLIFSDEDKAKFHELTVVFKSKDKHLLNLYDPAYLRFSLVGKSVSLPLTVVPKVPVLLSDVYSTTSSKVNVTGPYLDRKPESIVMQFKVKAVINKTVTMRFNLDSEEEKLAGKYVSGELVNTFDGIVDVKTDGLKYVEFSFDPAYKVDTEYTLFINLSFDTTGRHYFPYEKMSLYMNDEPVLTDEKLVPESMSAPMFTKEYSLRGVSDLGANLVPCLASDTQFSSSMFRSGDNATYIFTRMFDCKRPWLGLKSSSPSDISVTVVDDENTDGYNVTVTEPLSLSYPGLAKPALALMKSRRFYEHILYIFLDDTAVETVRKQMIAGKICEEKTGICEESDFMQMLEKFIKELFEEEEELFFAKTIVRFFDSKTSQFHYLNLNPDKILIREVKEVTKHKSIREAFEFSLDEAFAHSHANKMGSSFSMIAVVNNKFASEIKSDLKKFVPTTYGKSVNGLYEHPVFVDIIPLDENSQLVIGESSPLCTSTHSLSKENLKTYDDIKFEIDNGSFERPVFTNFKFTTKADLVTVHEAGPSGHFKGSHSEVKLEFNRNNFKVFFGISDVLPKTCVKELGESKIPVQKALKSSVTYAKETAKPYHIIATCASFGNSDLSKAEHNYLLSFKGIVLGDYSVVAKEEVPEKLFGECDLFTLYKYMPNAPNYSEKDDLPTIPDTIKSYKIEDHVQKMESAVIPVEYSEKYKKYLSYRELQKTIGKLDLDQKALTLVKRELLKKIQKDFGELDFTMKQLAEVKKKEVVKKTPAKAKGKTNESLEHIRYKVKQYIKLMKNTKKKVDLTVLPEELKTDHKLHLVQELLDGLDFNQVPIEPAKKK